MTAVELDDEPRPEGWLSRAAETRRGRRLISLGAGTLVVFLSVVVWLFGSTPPEIERPANVASLPSVDGTLLVVESDRLVLDAFTPVDGQQEVEFTIRERDASHFDLAHLRSHSSIALPTRLFYERDGDELFAVYKEDAPANSARETAK
ncbi:MAG: hypothetical protein JWM90_518 [Thermoleophilia bacterium]|nr:hypothetical protein [Thermoleophilia bacterium]